MSSSFDLLRAQVEEGPLCPASDGQLWLTGTHLRQHVAALREQLSSRLKKGDATAVVAEDRYHMLVACLAVWSLAGKVVLPPNHQPRALQHVIKTSQASVLLTDLALDRSLTQHVLGIDSALEQADAAPPPPLRHLVVDRAAPVLAVYTSGTTGEHQCCEKTAGQLFGEACVLVETFGFSSDSSVAATVPGYHLYGLLFTLLVPLLSGGRFIRPRLFQTTTIQETLQRHAVTDLVTVPAHMRALLAAGESLAALGRTLSSGAILEPALAEAFRARFHCEVLDVLGSTESGGIAWRRAASESTYTPLPGVSVSTNDDGRLLLRSPFLAPGSDWEMMNDKVRLVSGGFEHLGRPDGVVKLGGKRVAVQEVEARALALDGVSDAAVLVQPASELRGSQLWLAVASSEARWNETSLKRALADYFDPVVLPRRYRVVDHLPRDGFGKLKKSLLLRLFETKPELPANSTLQLPEPVLGSDAETQTLHSSLCIPKEWVFFRGHFSGNPIVPGVVQLSEIVLPSIARAWSDLTVLDEVPVLKYKRPISPGAALELTARRPLGSSKVRFEITEGGHVASTGQLKFKTGEQHAKPSVG